MGSVLDPPSLSRSQALTLFASKNLVTVADLIASIPANGPIVMAHRGGGGLLAPDNTSVGFRIGMSYNTGCLDGGDLYTLSGSGNELACIHNATPDYVSGGVATGNVNDYSVAGYSTLLNKPSAYFGGTFADEPMMTFSRMLIEFGGKTVLMPEAKDFDAYPVMLSMIKQYGLSDSTIACGFNRNQLKTYFVGSGIQTLLFSADGAGITPASVIADGFDWVGLSKDIADVTIASYVAAGIKVAVWVCDRQWQYDKYVAMGVKMFCSDDPLYASRQYAKYRIHKDTWKDGNYYHGDLVSGTGDDSIILPPYRGTFVNGRWKIPANTYPVAGNKTYYKLQGSISPLPDPTTYTVEVDVTFDALSTLSTRFAEVVHGVLTDARYTGLVTDNGYSCFLRQNGSLEQAYRDGTTATTFGTTKATGAIVAPLVLSAGLTAGAAITALPVTAIAAAIPAGAVFELPLANGRQQQVITSGASTVGATSIPITSATPGTAVASGSALPQTAHLKVVVTPTTVTVYRTDGASTSTTGLSWTHSSQRGGYVFLGLNDVGGTGTLSVSFSNLVRP